MNDKIPDSHWVASMVVAAFTEERYELGAALARLCVQAERMERDSAPMPAPVIVPPEVYEPTHMQTHLHTHDAPCRHEGHPNTPHLCMTGGVPLSPAAFEPKEKPSQCCGQSNHRHDHHPDTMWCCAREVGKPLASDEAGQAMLAESPAELAATAVNPVIPSTRCIALIGAPGGQRECHGVLYWSEPQDHGGGVWTAAGWEHLDGIHDHAPIPLAHNGNGEPK